MIGSWKDSELIWRSPIAAPPPRSSGCTNAPPVRRLSVGVLFVALGSFAAVRLDGRVETITSRLNNTRVPTWEGCQHAGFTPHLASISPRQGVALRDKPLRRPGERRSKPGPRTPTTTRMRDRHCMMLSHSVPAGRRLTSPNAPPDGGTRSARMTRIRK
jgi:hypothetical protein